MLPSRLVLVCLSNALIQFSVQSSHALAELYLPTFHPTSVGNLTGKLSAAVREMFKGKEKKISRHALRGVARIGCGRVPEESSSGQAGDVPNGARDP